VHFHATKHRTTVETWCAHNRWDVMCSFVGLFAFRFICCCAVWWLCFWVLCWKSVVVVVDMLLFMCCADVLVLILIKKRNCGVFAKRDFLLPSFIAYFDIYREVFRVPVFV
jgi:hypothetical protein